MSVTAKSVVFDIADNWGHGTYLGVRAIRFYLSGNLIALVPADFTAYATTTLSADYSEDYAFNTTLALVGNGVHTSWATTANSTASQRLIIVFNSSVEFDEIEISNYHNTGSGTDIGSKNVKITISSDAITDTTYNAAITNSTVLNDTVWPEHSAIDEADWQQVWADAAAVTNHIISNIMQYGDLTEARFAKMLMEYGIRFDRNSDVSMLYGIMLAQTCDMRYGDAPVLQQIQNMYYGDCPLLKKSVEMKYGELLQLKKITDMEYSILRPLIAISEARYGINGASLMSIMEQNYSLSEYNLLCKVLDMPYLLQSDSMVQTITTALIIAGKNIEYSHASVENHHDEYYITAEIHLVTEAEYLQIKEKEEVLLTSNDKTYKLFVESKKSSRPGVSQVKYIINCASPARLLSSDWSRPLLQEYPAALAEITINDLCGTLGPVEFLATPFPVLPNTLYANDEARRDIIRKLTQSDGARMQSNPDGSIRIEDDYPTPVPQWDTITPHYYMTYERNFVSQDETPVKKSGKNKYLVGNQLTSDKRSWTEKEPINDREVEVHGYQVPWGCEIISGLTHSGGPWVHMPEYMGVIEETYPPLSEDPEQIEFVAGFATASKPIYGDLQVDWLREQLGAITYAEDGKLEAELKTGATDGYSLAAIRYTTRYHKWIVRDDRTEDVQYLLWIEE